MLIKGYSKKSVGRNIKTEIDSGKSRPQAKAIAMSAARKAAAKAKKRSVVKKLKPKRTEDRDDE